MSVVMPDITLGIKSNLTSGGGPVQCPLLGFLKMAKMVKHEALPGGLRGETRFLPTLWDIFGGTFGKKYWPCQVRLQSYDVIKGTTSCQICDNNGAEATKTMSTLENHPRNMLMKFCVPIFIIWPLFALFKECRFPSWKTPIFMEIYQKWLWLAVTGPDIFNKYI